MNLSVNVVIAIVVCLIAIGVLVLATVQYQRTVRLKRRFGPEYAAAVSQYGSRSKAEAELAKREARVARMRLVPLSAADAARFSQAWRALQGRFVDNPKGVVGEADRLVRELMTKRGYPMGEFDRLAADLSVDHPTVVSNYRAARSIAVLDERGEADTEQLRKAVVHYRTLFDELLEIRRSSTAEAVDSESHIAVRS
ncbi:MAG TPA: hypothetical protein VGI93_16920 [Steroidobacteraceae bacterium]